MELLQFFRHPGTVILSEENVLGGLQALEELIAADNKLDSLPDSLFQALRNLRVLVLYGNMLRALPAGPFLSSNLKGKS